MLKYLNFWHLNTRVPSRFFIFMIFLQSIDVTRIPTNQPPTNHCMKRKQNNQIKFNTYLEDKHDRKENRANQIEVL